MQWRFKVTEFTSVFCRFIDFVDFCDLFCRFLDSADSCFVALNTEKSMLMHSYEKALQNFAS